MEREEKTVAVLLAAATLTLLTAYTFFPLGIQTYSPDSKVGERVHLEGEITDLHKTRQGHLILEIKDTTVFIPSNTASNLKLQKGKRIKITGTVQEYQGKREIRAESIEIPG